MHQRVCESCSSLSLKPWYSQRFLILQGPNSLLGVRQQTKYFSTHRIWPPAVLWRTLIDCRFRPAQEAGGDRAAGHYLPSVAAYVSAALTLCSCIRYPYSLLLCHSLRLLCRLCLHTFITWCALRLEDVGLNRVGNNKFTNRSAEALGFLIVSLSLHPLPTSLPPSWAPLCCEYNYAWAPQNRLLLLLQVGIMFETELHNQYGCCVVEGIAPYSGDVQPDTIFFM